MGYAQLIAVQPGISACIELQRLVSSAVRHLTTSLPQQTTRSRYSNALLHDIGWLVLHMPPRTSCSSCYSSKCTFCSSRILVDRCCRSVIGSGTTERILPPATPMSTAQPRL